MCYLRPILEFKRKICRSQEVIACLSLAFLLFVFPVFFIFQGLDFTDMGFVLVSSRDTLADPGNLPGYTTFLSMFINGLWMRISEPWGLLGAKRAQIEPPARSLRSTGAL